MMRVAKKFPWPPVLLFSLLVFAIPAHSQPATPSSQETLQMCLAVAADYSPVHPIRVYPSNTRELVAVYRVTPGAYQKVTGQFIAVDVPGAAGWEPKPMTTRLTKQTDRGSFTLRGGKLAPGKYRLAVDADGKPWKAVDFSVVAADPEVKVAGPGEVMGFSKGRAWIYDATVEGPDIAKGGPPRFARGPDGKWRGSVTMTVTDVRGPEVRVEARMGDQVQAAIFQVSQRGLLLLSRGSKTLDPPEVHIPWPLKAPHNWSYAPKDRSESRNYKIWGPVPIKGPASETPGYVVMSRQTLPDQTVVTSEQHFVPGIGHIREVSITAVRDRMVQRNEMVLREVR